jgi:hypothetical protein
VLWVYKLPLESVELSWRVSVWTFSYCKRNDSEDVGLCLIRQPYGCTRASSSAAAPPLP